MLSSLNDTTVAYFLDAISRESPCGVNLEDDTLFAQLELEAKGVPERQIGNSIIPEVEPDWNKIHDMGLELLERSRDIQVCVQLTCAWVRTDGFRGLDNGLTLINGLLQKYWDEVYPRQDPDDDFPVLRINSLTTLNNYKKILGPINHIPLTQSQLGNFSWRDCELSEGKITAGSNNITEPSEKSILEAAFLDTDLEILKNLEKTVKHASVQAQEIVDVITGKTNSEIAPDISSLITLLKNISRLLNEKVQQKQSLDLSRSQSEAEASQDLAAPGDKQADAGRIGKSSGVHSREDVVRGIDAICKYFERYEPSSPIPFILLRAKKLLSMNFMEILEELTPDAVRQAENICGIQKKDKT
ncbi:Type VI secretion-associated protein, ImpA family [Candidatus Methylobacter favarea]|uniref:Type VI secretion-associated protein, ImpA family n=1 Tax=Candidatus Methylobacter favarea TaxID=2707345 RepID=A0A8S0X714_9GAMM|nr:type VI secretion system protein TssA [Candidatus Methylobacter favarea]CAA9889685.1 Type VI secretion-associated protein, ImpA family [Candidatus Methylobacter favarea]